MIVLFHLLLTWTILSIHGTHGAPLRRHTSVVVTDINRLYDSLSEFREAVYAYSHTSDYHLLSSAMDAANTALELTTADITANSHLPSFFDDDTHALIGACNSGIGGSVDALHHKEAKINDDLLAPSVWAGLQVYKEKSERFMAALHGLASARAGSGNATDVYLEGLGKLNFENDAGFEKLFWVFGGA